MKTQEIVHSSQEDTITEFRNRLRLDLDPRINDAVIGSIIEEYRANEIKRMVSMGFYERQTVDGQSVYKSNAWEVDPKAVQSPTLKDRLRKVSRECHYDDIIFELPGNHQYVATIAQLNQTCDELSRLSTDDKELFEKELKTRIGDCFKGLKKALKDRTPAMTMEFEELTQHCFFYSAWHALLRGFNEHGTSGSGKVESEKEQSVIQDEKFDSKQATVEAALNAMAENGWRYAFRSESDYNEFVALLVKFFMQADYSLPDTIELKPRCKTRLAQALHSIYTELGRTMLARDKHFFKLLRCLNHFKEDRDLYRTVTRSKI